MEELVPFLAEDDEELVLFDIILNTKNREYYYLKKNSGVFDIRQLTDDYCYTHFRFNKADIQRLVAGFKIPDKVILQSGAKVNGVEAMCILLKRLAYPNRYADLMQFFPRGRSVLSEVFNYMIDFVLKEKGHIITNLNSNWLSNQRIRDMCKDIQRKGSPYNHCFGFIDGTVKGICRPTYVQREFYNGHKRLHSLKYQSMILPNGILYNLFGSVPGRRHDGYLLAKSRLLQMFGERFAGYADPPYIYGDLGYPLKKFWITPFKGTLTNDQRKLNKKMSSLRVSVEWGFAKILQLFSFVDFKKNNKICKQNVAKYYKVSALLTNCHTCLYGSQVSQYFDCEPPQLETYLI